MNDDVKEITCDLHVHSKCAMATSPKLDLENNALWARRKGIDIVGTGGFTHPEWFAHLKEALVPDESAPGLYVLKEREGANGDAPVRFLLSTETSHMYREGGAYRRVHLVTLAPSLEVVARIRDGLAAARSDLAADGRPSTSLSISAYMDLVLSVCEDCMVIPAHIWTPWYGVMGSRSGFRSLRRAFGGFYDFVYAVESGLSSDPAMNWGVVDFEGRAIVSFSDAHSPRKLGRELTVLRTHMSYAGVVGAIKFAGGMGELLGDIFYTIEYFPQEGKYYNDGHRKCGVSRAPSNTTICPVCGRGLTLGVNHRIKDVGGLMNSNRLYYEKINDLGVRWIVPRSSDRRPFVRLVPLLEILSEVYGVGVNTKTVTQAYMRLIGRFGSELQVLLKVSMADVEAFAGERLALAISRVRSGELIISPGYDGVFGEVRIFEDEERKADIKKQRVLFDA